MSQKNAQFGNTRFFLRHPEHTYIFLRYDILFLRYIPAGSDLELECQVDLGDHGPDDHYRYLRFSFLFTCILHAYMSSGLNEGHNDEEY